MNQPEYTRNETISLMHQDKASAFRAIADHIEKLRYSPKEIIKLLRECADEVEAQAVVADLRDTL